MTPQRSAAATAVRRPRPDANPQRPSRHARPRVRSPRRRRPRPQPGRTSSWRPTCPSVPAFTIINPRRLTRSASAPFRVEAAPLSGRLYGHRWQKSQHTVPGFPSPFDAPAFASRIILRPPEDRPPSRSAHQTMTAWTPTGLSRSARDRYDRGGCPLYPGDGGALPPGQARPGGTCRLTTTGPYLPLEHPTEREC